MTWTVSFRRIARRELNDAIAWYEERRVGLGQELSYSPCFTRAETQADCLIERRDEIAYLDQRECPCLNVAFLHPTTNRSHAL